MFFDLSELFIQSLLPRQTANKQAPLGRFLFFAYPKAFPKQMGLMPA
jgi:hypothetical protein